MILRLSKTSLVFGVAIFYSFVVFNNLTDYDSNFQFIRHVLMMDSTFPGNRGMWRAMNSPVWHTVFYATIILWETLTMILCWWAGVRMARSCRAGAREFAKARGLAIAALTVSPPHVAGGVFVCRRRMVSDVAIEDVERPGSRDPHVHGGGYCPASGGATRRGRSALADFRDRRSGPGRHTLGERLFRRQPGVDRICRR